MKISDFVFHQNIWNSVTAGPVVLIAKNRDLVILVHWSVNNVFLSTEILIKEYTFDEYMSDTDLPKPMRINPEKLDPDLLAEIKMELALL